MMASVRLTLTATLLLLLFLSGVVFTLQRVDALRTDATMGDVLYFSSPKVLRRLSLGYTGLMADIYWTRAVQYFGSKHQAHADQYRLLAPLLEITTDLDPHLVVAYEFGATFLSPRPPQGAGMPERAVELVEKGIRANPNDWRLYYNLGFIDYLELHNYRQAAEAFQRGSEVPGANPLLKAMAAKMAEHAGDSRMARMLWITALQSTQEPSIRLNAVAHLRALDVDEAITALEAILARYREVRGQYPASFNQLVQAGALSSIPRDPTGKPYQLLPDGRVEVRDPDHLPFITKGIPPGYKPPRPNLDNLKLELPH